MNFLKTIFLILYISILFIGTIVNAEINNSHAIAMHGEPKYDINFTHLEYVNPNAPKGGKVIFSATGSYDSFNPFILKGTPASGIEKLYETLTKGSSDEAFTEYGLIAESIKWPDDRSWVEFKIRKEAIWHDGEKIKPEDVIWTFNILMEKGHPFYKYYYGDILDIIKINNETVRFNFKNNTNL